MSLPSKPQQIAAVAKFLDSDFQEGKSLTEVAKAIVDGFHDVLVKDLKKPATPLQLGGLIKSPLSGTAYRVAWMEDGLVWLVTDSTSYGWLGAEDNDFWESCEEYRPKKRVEVDGKGKMVEMTEAEIAEAWTNPDWKVGDRVSQHQRQFKFEIIATAPQSVLMRRDGVPGEDGLISDSVRNLEQYYRRESKIKEVGW